VVPSRLEFKQRAPGTAGPGQRDSTDTANGLVRSADLMLEKGDVEAARALLQQAAELGSGPAALKLGRSYDPTQSRAPAFADSQTNPALAKAWYERALALGSQEAASYISDASGR
jgi:TPR repeat protein